MKIFCLLGWHRYRNTSDGRRHGAVCMQCGTIAGNMWVDGSPHTIALTASHRELVEALEREVGYGLHQSAFCRAVYEEDGKCSCTKKRSCAALAQAHKLMEAPDA